jgi:pSer/pThr/pTyr-binding forkhead associated (FHA) protein
VQIDLVIRKQNDPDSYTITCDLAERLIFGRSIGSPVNLAGSEISREHFALFSRHGEICIQDLSSNGTVVNGKPVPQQKPQKLGEGDVISIPGYEIEVARRLSMAPAQQAQNHVPPEPENAFSASREPFTFWEIVVVAAAIASFVLIVYYFTR